MALTLHDHVLKVADLIDQPGASRRVDLAMPAPEDYETPVASVKEPLELAGVVESVVEGILVRGALTMRLRLQCARCLEALEETADADVVELFQDPARVPPEAGEVEAGYEIQEGHIDLDALLRDTLAPATPYRPLCTPECRGLCVDCGANLNAVTCSCGEDDIDPRWEVLRQLDLPPEPRDP